MKLASNEGAFGPLPAAVAAFEAAAAELNRYPDGGAAALREALAERHGLPPEQVVLGNGADELIRLCAVAALDAGDAAVFPWPSFPELRGGRARCTAPSAVQVPLRSGRFDLDARARGLHTPAPGGGACGSCSWPTRTTRPARCSSRAEVRGFLDALPDRVLCVLDEAYAEYADAEPEGPALVREGHGRLCVLRTFSKVYGLAALRVGYALASPEVADALDRVRPIFNVNQPAQEAALASLGERDAVAERVAHAVRARARLARGARRRRARPDALAGQLRLRGRAGGRRRRRAGRPAARGGLHRARAARASGRPGAIRVTCGTDEENAAFAAALATRVAG